MRIERLGRDEPEVAVIGAVHGDEPCGARAVEALIEDPPTVERPVALVVANEEALAAGERYLDEDLNRAFPGDAAATTHEGRLAAELSEAIGDCETLSMHSTQSHPEPFGIVNGVTDFARQVAPHLTLDALVDAGGFDRGRLFEGVPETIEVECGHQGSTAAAENAKRLSREFLAAVGATSADSVGGPVPGDGLPLPVYRLVDKVPKRPADEYDVHVENFEAVAAGEVFASADGEPIEATGGFYPVLLSAEGYADQFGYTAEFVEMLG